MAPIPEADPGFSKGVTFVKEGGEYSLSWITKICELGACFSYFPYVLAQNGGMTSHPLHDLPGSILVFNSGTC